MLRFVICDDEQVQIEYLSDLLGKWAAERGALVDILSYASAESFLFAYEDIQPVDLLLLDIQMGKMDGMALARHLRSGNDNVPIVFITGYQDFMADGYDVSALHYLLKPVDAARLFAVLDKAVSNIGKEEEGLLVKTGEAVHKVAFKDIVYVEAFAHYVKIKTTAQDYETRANIGDIAAQIGEGFIRCHRSYIVGLRHVSHITKTDVVLDDGESIPLSRRLYKDVNRAFIRHHRGSV